MDNEDPYDEPDELSDERCAECGAWPEDYHEIDCSRGDDEDEFDDGDLDEFI